MKIALLILCHKNPDQIKKFINLMKSDLFDIFIHVDKKSQMELTHLESDSVHILPESKRVNVTWGGLSQIDATLNLIQYANQYGNYDYYWLCSGQDIPVKSIEYMRKFFVDHSSNEFINLFQTLNNGGKQNNYDKRNDLYYPIWIQGLKLWQRILKRLYVEITGGYNKTSIARRKNYTGMKFFYGSQWWCLSGEAIRWILVYIENHDGYYQFFRNVTTPDECFFHTLIMNSPYALKRQEYLHYIDWSNGGNSPKMLDNKDLDTAQKSKYLMARKVEF